MSLSLKKVDKNKFLPYLLSFTIMAFIIGIEMLIGVAATGKSDSLISGIGKAIQEGYNVILGIMSPIACFIFLKILVFDIILAVTDKDVSGAVKNIKNILIAVIVAFFVPSIIGVAVDAISEKETTITNIYSGSSS